MTSMTNLIELNEYRATAAREGERRASGASARILLFTGVRYERMDDPTPQPRVGHA